MTLALTSSESSFGLAERHHVAAPDNIALYDVVDAANSIAAAAHEAAGLEPVLRTMARAFVTVTGVSRCSVALPEPATEVYRLALSLGKADYTARARPMLDGRDALSEQLLTHRSPVVIDDTRRDPRLAPLVRASNALGAYSMFGVPILFGQRVVALAFLDNEFEQAGYAPQQVDSAALLGTLCGSSLVTASALADREKALRQVRQENEVMRRLSRLESLLEGLTADGLSPASYAHNAARLLGRPVTIYDRTWTRVASADIGVQVSVANFGLGDRPVRSHPRVQAELEQVRRGQTRIIGPLPAVGMHSRAIVAPVKLGAENWGVLVAHEASRAFQPFEAEAASRVGAHFGAALAAANKEATTVAALRSAVAYDLVHGAANGGDLASRAQAAGFGPGRESLLVVFDSLSATALCPDAKERLTETLGAVLGEVTVVPVDDDRCLAILGTAPADCEQLTALLTVELAGHPALDGVIAVLSNPFADPLRAKEAYRECRQAMRCVHRFRHAGLPRASRVSEFGAALPFMASVDVSEARDYARTQLHGLEGSAGEDDLITTLRVFVDSLNVRRCARVLEVHENTVRYRLARIEKLTGLNLLNDATGQLRAELAVSAMRLIGDLPWNAPVKS